jgi:predicted O-linked N-acetylglucosamine transferase (SPINDLY family)
MDPSLAAADAALKAQQPDVALTILTEAAGKPDASALVIRKLGTLLFQLKRFEEGATWTKLGTDRFPKDWEMWNVLGVCYRRTGRSKEALAALDKAQKLAPKSLAPILNKVNVYNDIHDGDNALPLALRLVREQPKNGEYHRLAGVAYRNRREYDKAIVKFDMAIRYAPNLVDAWSDRAQLATGLQRHDEALDITERGIAALPNAVRLRENKAVLLRRAGRTAECEAYLRDVLEKEPDTAWAYFQLGRTIADQRREEANGLYRKAFELQPDNIVFGYALVENLERSRYGVEGEHIEEAYQLMLKLLEKGPPGKTRLQTARQVCLRVGDYALLNTFGSFEEVGRDWARAGNHAAFLQHIGRVATPEDRLELVRQHRMWGEHIESVARTSPIAYPQPRSPDGRIRLGFMSSDLRAHPVAYFAMPVFEFIDRSRFDVYCYSFYSGLHADRVQQEIASKVEVFRWTRSISDHDAAQMIANDQLDMLFELGGSTHMNKLEVCAYRPAPIQASWLGYPHSAGLSTIDYLLTDPFITPTREGMLIEQPLKMPKSWISLGTNAFRETDVVNPETPEERNGFITFGTANNPHKYSAELIRTWARVVAATPNSQFLFVRPEGSAPSFCANLRKLFAEEGVAPERVRFNAVRGQHMPHYNEIDIALDTFPLTGGTTTCETLWMGVPVVAKVGDAFFERLSYSILNNAGLGDLVAETEAQFVEIAQRLAADPGRRKALRAGLREQLKASPLGQREQFAKDFYDLIARTVEQHRA